MRILIVHNHYGKFAAGGEANVMAAEVSLLKNHGHTVMTYERTNSEVESAGITGKVKSAWNSTWSKSGYDAVRKVILNFNPDIMHVHNYWLLLSPSIFAAAKDSGVATVLTLHNYRLMCPGGQFLRGNEICELCLGGNPWRALIHCCYPGGSFLKSLLSVRLYIDTRNRKYLSSMVDAYIALSKFGRNKFIEGGLPEEKVHVKPNFMEDPYGDSAIPPLGNGAICIGRISSEKGVETLLNAWQGVDYPLTIIGDGPLLEKVKRKAPANVTFTGQLSQEHVLLACKNSSIFIFPSNCYEGFPLSLLEAMATGRAIIASNLGPRREMISDGETGVLFEAGNSEDLHEKVMLLIGNQEMCQDLGTAARLSFLKKYTPETNFSMLMDIYRNISKAI